MNAQRGIRSAACVRRQTDRHVDTYRAELTTANALEQRVEASNAFNGRRATFDRRRDDDPSASASVHPRNLHVSKSPLYWGPLGALVSALPGAARALVSALPGAARALRLAHRRRRRKHMGRL